MVLPILTSPSNIKKKGSGLSNVISSYNWIKEIVVKNKKIYNI
jgi:tetrahydromethanopterin S-methyltransferase subunit H